MVSILNLKKNYGDFSLDISMDILQGRITGLIGKNGAGKSTAIKAIIGLLSPDGGSIKVFGKNPMELKPEDKKDIGVALADSGFSGYLTISDIAKILDKMYDDFDKDIFLKKCNRCGLKQDKQIQKFSTGMKAKLRVLVALSHNANLLIMDEPTAGMDIEARIEIMDIIREYMAEKEERSVLITSHIATDLEGLCDDVYLIDNGKIVLHEDTDVILSDYAVMKIEEKDIGKIDQSFILSRKSEYFGYRCLTNQKQYYIENYPGIVIEKCGIDDLILMMNSGEVK